MRISKTVLSVIFSVVLIGCTKITDPVITSHGYAPNSQDINIIKTRNLTKQQIQDTFGVPFMVGANNPNYWYYMSYQTTQYGFGKRKYKNFNLIELKFKNNIVAFVKKYSDKDFNEIAFSSAKTSTSGKKLGVFEQMISNVGRFRPKEKQTSH